MAIARGDYSKEVLLFKHRKIWCLREGIGALRSCVPAFEKITIFSIHYTSCRSDNRDSKKDIGKRISKGVNNDFVKFFFTLGDACQVSFLRMCFAVQARYWTCGTWFNLVFA